MDDLAAIAIRLKFDETRVQTRLIKYLIRPSIYKVRLTLAQELEILLSLLMREV